MKEEINLEEEIKRLEKEIKRMEEENPSVIEEAEEFWQNLSFEDNDGNDLESEEFNTEKTERVYTLKNKTKIIYKYDKNTVDLNDCEDKLSKIEKYNKDGKIEVECFYHYGFLKKIIYYNEEETSLSYIFIFPLYEKLKMYYVTGGMPEAVYMWTQERDIELVRKTLNNILEAYERDFAKHPNIYEFPKISMIWKSIPSQLSKENKKFIYKVVKEGARAREYEDALQWLVNANLVTKVFRWNNNISAFKIYLVDVGLLTRLSQLSPNTFGEGNRLFTEFKGALTENYILQGLISQFEVTPRYWAENNYEVDFIIQNENNIIPIEVKAETNIKSRSSQKFKEKFKDDIKLRVRFSFENLKLDDDLLNIPLFMVDYTEKIINIALNKNKEKNNGQ